MSRLMEEWRSSENLIALSTSGTNVSSLIALDDYQWRSHLPRVVSAGLWPRDAQFAIDTIRSSIARMARLSVAKFELEGEELEQREARAWSVMPSHDFYRTG